MKYLSYFLIVTIFSTLTNNKIEVDKNNKSEGFIKYSFISNTVSKEEKQKSKELYSLLDKMNTEASDLKFILRFNSEESIFNLERQMESDVSPMAVSYAKNVISKGIYYFNRKKDILLIKNKSYSGNVLLQSKPSLLKWSLSTESKKIGKYLCYKATQTKLIENNSGKHKFLIEAWYCPDIPLPYGPNEFNGLPGLILELKDTHHTFYANKISLGVKQNIKPLSSDVILSEEEFNESKNRN